MFNPEHSFKSLSKEKRCVFGSRYTVSLDDFPVIISLVDVMRMGKWFSWPPVCVCTHGHVSALSQGHYNSCKAANLK